MARWNIRRALEVAALLRERWPEHWLRLANRLGLGDAELGQWREAAETLATGYNSRTGIFEQFTGFFGLDDVDLAQYSKRTATMEAVLGRERTRGSKAIKQADVVALLGLLPEEFDQPTIAANFRYYEPRCAHDSSLSRSMHALIAARLGDTELALRYFRESAAIDLADTAGGSAGGIHIAALGGLWQVVILGFAGLSWQGDALSFEPQLPADWSSLGFCLQWRGRRLKVQIEQSGPILNATLEAGETLTVVVSGEPHELARGRAIRVSAGSAVHDPSLSAERQRWNSGTADVPKSKIGPTSAVRNDKNHGTVIFCAKFVTVDLYQWPIGGPPLPAGCFEWRDGHGHDIECADSSATTDRNYCGSNVEDRQWGVPGVLGDAS